MTKMRSAGWLLATIVFGLFALVLCAGGLVRLSRFGFPETASKAALFSASILVSAGTIVYASLELFRYALARKSLLPRFLSVIAILFGGAASIFLLTASLPKLRSADTTIIPELALPPDDPRLSSPGPTHP